MLIGAGLVAAAMVLYPPFCISTRGATINQGHAFLFRPPNEVATVNLVQLLPQWMFVAAMSFVGWFALKDKPVIAPDSIGAALVSGAKSASKSRIWTKLFQTGLVLLVIWATFCSIVAWSAYPNVRGLALGWVPLALYWLVGRWWSWLRS